MKIFSTLVIAALLGPFAHAGDQAPTPSERIKKFRADLTSSEVEIRRAATAAPPIPRTWDKMGCRAPPDLLTRGRAGLNILWELLHSQGGLRLAATPARHTCPRLTAPRTAFSPTASSPCLSNRGATRPPAVHGGATRRFIAILATGSVLWGGAPWLEVERQGEISAITPGRGCDDGCLLAVGVVQAEAKNHRNFRLANSATWWSMEAFVPAWS